MSDELTQAQRIAELEAEFREVSAQSERFRQAAVRTQQAARYNADMANQLEARAESAEAEVKRLRAVVEKRIAQCRVGWTWNHEAFDPREGCLMPQPHDESCDVCSDLRAALSAAAPKPCPHCSAGMPMSCQPGYHWTGGSGSPKCEAPKEVQS